MSYPHVRPYQIDSLSFALAVLLAVCLLGCQPPPESEQVINISFEDVKFDIEKGGDYDRSMLTEKIEGLDGKLVRIRGFMYPSFRRDGLWRFVLLQNTHATSRSLRWKINSIR